MQLKKISRIAQHTAKTIIRIEDETQNKLQDKEGQTTKLKLARRYVVQAWSWRISLALQQLYTELVQKYQAAPVHYRGVRKDLPYKIHPGRIGSRPVAATSDVTEEQWRNNESPGTEIRHCKWNDGFGAKPTLTNHKQHGETISSYRQNGQNLANNPKPSVHCVISTEL